MIPIPAVEKQKVIEPKCENTGCGIVDGKYDFDHFDIVDDEKQMQFKRDSDQFGFHWCIKCGGCVGMAAKIAINIQLEPKFGKEKVKEQERNNV